MWALVIFGLLVGGATASSPRPRSNDNYVWQSGNLYHYSLESIAAVAQNQVSDDYVGVIIRSNLTVQRRNNTCVSIKLVSTEYANVNHHIDGGWNAPIVEKEYQFQQLPLIMKRFDLGMNGTFVSNFTADGNAPIWETNIGKAIATVFHLDTMGTHAVEGSPNPFSPNAVFTNFESGVTGKCNVRYAMNQIPKYIAVRQPQLGDPSNWQEESILMDITKSTNYTRCSKRPVSYYGLGAQGYFKAMQNTIGTAMSHSTNGHAMISGTPTGYRIQYSSVETLLKAYPLHYTQQEGMSGSRISVRLESVQQTSTPPPQVDNPVTSQDLVYVYPQGQELRHLRSQFGQLPDDSSSSSSDSEGDSEGSSSSGQSKNSNESSQSDEYDDSESSSSEERTAKRFRRSLSKLSPDYLRQQSSSESSSSDSSSESTSSSEEATWHLLPKVYMNQAPVLPFNRYFLGRRGRPLTNVDGFDAIGETVRIFREIGADMQHLEDILNLGTQEKFIQGRGIIRLLNNSDILKAADKLQPGTSASQQANDTWIAFIDALSQSGIKPALTATAVLIKRGVLETELQARALSFLAKFTFFSTRDYIEAFWDLLQSPEVKGVKSVYFPGMLAFTNMLYVGTQARDVTADLVNVYGKPVEGKDKNIADEYVEKLEKYLQKSMSANRTDEVHLYIRSIGNIGSDQVVEVFEPYLTGEEYSTKVQRQWMVMALDKLGQRNKTLAVQPVYKIIASRGEDSGVRSLSCFMFMSFKPNEAEMLKMAQHLRQEPDRHVISACATALLAASKLEGPEFEQLAKGAQAATKVMATNITGIQRSSKYWYSHVLPKLNLEYEAQLGIVGSTDQLWPKGARIRASTRRGGLKSQVGEGVALMSSARDFIENILEQIITEQDLKSETAKARPRSGPIPFTLDDIKKHFNVKTDIKDALEAVFYSNFLHTPILFSQDNDTVSHFAEGLKDLARNASKGLDFQTTKFVVRNQLHVGLPNALGLPTASTLVKPLILSINGNITATTIPDITKNSPKNKVLQPQVIKAKIQATIAVSTMARGDISLVFPYKDSNVNVAGLKFKTQATIPVEITIYVDVPNNFLSIEIEPLNKHDKQRVLQLSETPYVYVQKAADLSQPQLQILHKRQPTVWSTKYGQQSTGLAFQVDYLSEMLPNGKKLFYSIVDEHPLKRLLLPFTHSEVAHRNISVYYVPQQSTTSSVVLRAFYDERQSEADDSDFRRSHPRNLKRQQQSQGVGDLLQQALNGIQYGKAELWNVSAHFEGQNSARYSAAVAIANSFVSTKNRALFKFEWQNVTASRISKALLNITGEFPLVRVMSADNVNPNGTVYIRLNTTQGMEISGTVNVERTLRRQQYVENGLLSQVCKSQMESGNKIQYACRNTTISKGFLNRYDLRASVRNVDLGFANYTYKIVHFLSQRLYPSTSVNFVNASGKADTITALLTISPEGRSFNGSLTVGEKVSINATESPIHPYLATFLMTHVRLGKAEVSRNMATKGEANATCAVDRSLVNTFDNSTYSVRIGECWTTVLLTARKRNANGTVPTPGTPEEVAVLIRSTGQYAREFKVQTEFDELIGRAGAMSSQSPYPQIEVLVNGQSHTVKKGESKTLNGRDQSPLVTILGEYDSLRMEIMDMIINFDGQRLQLQAEKHYKTSIRGLCGTFDGQRKTDFKVPRNCILGNETAFVQEYVFPQGCKAPLPRPQYNLCVKEVIIVGNDTSESEIVPGSRPLPGPGPRQRPQGGHDDVDVDSDRFMEYRTLVKEYSGKLCFSVRPVRQCNDKSEPKSTSEESVTFHCVAKTEPASKWAQKVHRGEVLDFLLKKKGHSSHSVSLPTACKPLH